MTHGDLPAHSPVNFRIGGFMDTRLMGKRLALGWTAALIVCSVGTAGEASSEPAAQADDAVVSPVTQVECKPRKRTSEFWAPVSAARVNQEWNQHVEASSPLNTRLDPPKYVTGSPADAEARKVARVLTQTCELKAVDAKDSSAATASTEKKAPSARRAGPR